MDSPQFDGQLFQLRCTNLNKGFAGYPWVVAEFVHPVPVSGVYTQLLHQLQTYAAFPPQNCQIQLSITADTLEFINTGKREAATSEAGSPTDATSDVPVPPVAMPQEEKEDLPF